MQRQSAIRNPQSEMHRRGVILLVVLVTLILFSAVAATFVISARQFRSTAAASQSYERYDQGYVDLLRAGAMQLFRGTNNPYSSAGGHGLLEDMYGSDGLPPPGSINYPVVVGAGPVPGAAAPSGLIFVDLAWPAPPPNVPSQLSRIDSYYAGQLLTCLDEPVRAFSTRILAYDYDAPSLPGGAPAAPRYRFFLRAFKNNQVPRIGTRCVINGRPFNGTGFGLNAATGEANRTSPIGGAPSPIPYALLSNPHAFEPSPGYLDFPGPGGADEPEDIVDFNDMALTLRAWDNSRGAWVVVAPAFFRPEVAHYFFNHSNPAIQALARGGNNPAGRAFQRKYMMRPVPEPLGGGAIPFDGGNREFTVKLHNLDGSNNGLDRNNNGIVDTVDTNVTSMRWDVDNDGDGLTDSIWVDLGMPVQKDNQGRMYKPLFAFMVLDMDSRLNLNAHGNQMQARNAPLTGRGPAQVAAYGPEIPPQFLAGNAGNPVLPVDQGVGPQGVGLGNVFSQADLQTIIHGILAAGAAPPVNGRHGEFGATGGVPSMPGRTDNTQDPRDTVINTDFPNPPTVNPAGRSAYAPSLVAAADVGRFNFPGPAINPNQGQYYYPTAWHGAGVVGIDKGGRLLRAFFNAQGDVDHPFQLRPYPDFHRYFGPQVPLDAPFTMAELEVILRMWDVDQPSLASRVPRLAGNLLVANAAVGVYNTGAPNINSEMRRGIITAESYAVPVYSAQPTREMRAHLAALPLPNAGAALPGASAGLHITDLLRARIRQSHVNPPPPGVPNPTIVNNVDTGFFRQAVMTTLSPELLAGRRMSLNWRFGDGLDNNNNGVIDEPNEQPGTVLREDYARWLYCLAMLMLDSNNFVNNDGRIGNRRQYTAKRIAQWAVNVVDNMDQDSIMTRFAYDENPFYDDNGDAAQPNSNGTWEPPNTNAFTVWGCEKNQVLLSETLAMHDCRTEDLDTDDGDMDETMATDPTGTDLEFDQRRRPLPSLFMELLNPSLEPVPPELRDTTNMGVNAVDLSRMAPQGRPVWRISLTVGAPNGPVLPYDDPQVRNNNDPFDGDLARQSTFPDTGNASRIVWLSTAAPGGAMPEAGKTFYTGLQANSPNWENYVTWDSSNVNAVKPMYLMYPGQYSVIGSRVRTRIGRSGANNAQNQSVSIVLLDENAGSAQPPATGFFLRGANPDPANAQYINAIRKPMGIVINEPRPLSITGPDPGAPATVYPAPTATSQDPDNPTVQFVDTYPNPVHDAPFDVKEYRTPGHYANKAFAYLQRLANPLAPFNAQTNPYITVDYMPVPLTVYNGETGTADPDTMGVNPPSGATFDTAVRGNLPNLNNLWSQRFERPRGGQTANALPPNMGANTGCSLGFVNRTYAPNGQWWGRGAAAPHVNYLGMPFASAPGQPQSCWPWIAWNDRPYNNPMELLQVPASAPSRLLFEFSMRNDVDPLGNPPFGAGTNRLDHYHHDNFPYRHLLNFFSSAKPATLPNNEGTDLLRIFDYLTVPSRFDGADDILTPQQLTAMQQMAVLDPQKPVAGLNLPNFAPFNHISNFREPGQVNLNTVFDDGRTFASLLNNFNDYNACVNLWRNMVWPSRQGFGGYNNGIPTLNASYPTFFANPFRSYANSYNVPRLPDDNPPNMPANQPRLASRGLGATVPYRDHVDSTFLRMIPQHEAAAPGNPRRPVFGSETNVDANNLGFGAANQAHNDANRNPYFRYQAIQSLGNKVTTRSNVYAVWITVGYFEVHPATSSANNSLPRTFSPESVVLGQELGSDTGDIVRHRGFFVFDRSIPVGFLRGEDLNVENAVLVNRVIE